MQQNNTIKILPQSVVEKIAAGEVVERPASVLKELIENSIDASSTKIDIHIENAGLSLIKVIDNGSGMSTLDLGKCLLPHATSKISKADDLFNIATMGFRGEALASVAAVSRLKVVSSFSHDGLGYAIGCEGGELGSIVPEPRTRGTTISVSDLFYNVPARKKFLKSTRGEQLAITRMLEQLVIPFPSIHFTLTIEGKRTLDFPIAQDLSERIGAVAGNQFCKTLIQCSKTGNDLEALIFVSSPEQQLRERPRFQSLFVNLRRINNDSVTFAVKEAFSQFLGSTFRPSFFCFLNIEPSRIDVNVHPTKQQIKFDNERELFGFIFSTVKQGISSCMMKPEQLISGDDFTAGRIQKTAVPYANSFYAQGEKGSFALREKDTSQTILPFPSSGGRGDEKEVDQLKDNTIQLGNEVPEENWDLISCYQIHAVFILAPIKNGILMIDQHAAHERVLYEQALQDLKQGRSASQQLLFPIVMELTGTEKAIVESGQKFLQSFGFEIGDFGQQALSISAIPAFLRDGAVEDTIRGIVKYLLEGKDPEAFLEPEKRFAAAFACGAAIKAGQKLSQEEMNALLNSLFSTKNPYICPHGRPTLVRISLDELSRRFLR